MATQLIGFCLTLAPVFLLIVSALGLFKVMSVGPAEFPKDHPVNTTLSYLLMASALGMFYYRFSTHATSQILGIVLAVGCIVAYTIVVARHRKEFPHKPTEELYRETKKRMEQRSKDRFIRVTKEPGESQKPDNNEKQ